MAGRAYPVRYRVEIASSAQGGQWEGEVTAMSRLAAVLLAGFEMGRAGRWPTESPWIRVEPAEPDGRGERSST